MGFGAIIFGITFWLIVDSHKKRKLEKKWDDEHWEEFYRTHPAAWEMQKKEFARTGRRHP